MAPKISEGLVKAPGKLYPYASFVLILQVSLILFLQLYLDSLFSNTHVKFLTIGIIVVACTAYHVSSAFQKITTTPGTFKCKNICKLEFCLITGFLWGSFLVYGIDVTYQTFIALNCLLISVLLIFAALVFSQDLLYFMVFSLSLAVPAAMKLLGVDNDVFFAIGYLLLAQSGLVIYTIRQVNLMPHQVPEYRTDFIQIAEKKTNAEKDVAEKKLQIDQDNANKALFLDTACHDLKLALSAITLTIEAIAATQINHKQRSMVKTLENSANTMEHLLNVLLDTSRLEKGIIQPNYQHFMLESILTNIRAEGLNVNQRKGLDFQCDETKCIAYTDPFLLEIIVRNLVANAFRYTPEGKVWINCTNLDNGTLTIEIGDTGMGIHANYHAKIFNEYYQMDNPDNDKSRGFGLGLAIVQKLTKILHLEIELDSEQGRGTRFILTVPQGLQETTSSEQ